MEKDIEPPTRWLIYSTILLSCFLIFSSTTYAADNKSDVISGWFKPSGPEHDKYEYKWYYRSWVSECPACHSHDLAYNPKGVPEAEITCMRCSADFDGVTGWEKQYNPRWKLTPAKKSSDKSAKVEAAETTKVVTKHQWLLDQWKAWNKEKSW